MKTKLINFLLWGGVFLALPSIAQKIKLNNLPHNTGHYVIIDNANEFANLQLSVLELKPNGTKPEVERIRLLGENFFYLKPEYFDAQNGNFEIQIIGFDENGDPLDDITAPVIPANPPVLTSYQWKCVSPDYAFGLTASYEVGNDSFWLNELNNELVWWPMSVQFPISLNGYPMITNGGEFMAMPGAQEEVPHENPLLIRYDFFGGQIPVQTGLELRGLPKKLLPEWVNFQGELGNPNSNNSFNCVMANMSNYPFNIPASYYQCVDNAVVYANILQPDLDLYCAGMLKPVDYNVDWEYSPSDWWVEWTEELWNDFVGRTGWFEPSNNNNQDVWDMMIAALNQAHVANEIPSNTLDQFHAVRFDNLTTKEYYYFSAGDFAAAALNRNNLSFTLNPGLYKTTMILSNGEMQHLYFATTERLNNGLDMKDYISILAFPNPVVGNSYSLKIDAQINAIFDYEVLNLQGVSLHKDRFQIRANTSSTPVITPIQGVPSGIIVHKFTYPDGSWESFMTTK